MPLSMMSMTVLLQEGLNALNARSDLWQLPLSLQKCTILHLGRKYLKVISISCYLELLLFFAPLVGQL